MLDEVIQLDKKYYLNTFGDRLPVCFEKGEGMEKKQDNFAEEVASMMK